VGPVTVGPGGSHTGGFIFWWVFFFLGFFVFLGPSAPPPPPRIARGTTAYICSRLYTQPPMRRATYMLRNICATLRNVAQDCARLRKCCAPSRNIAHHCATLRKCCASLRKCCAPYKYTYEVCLSILKYTYKYTMYIGGCVYRRLQCLYTCISIPNYY
jgi:hypothetical protein